VSATEYSLFFCFRSGRIIISITIKYETNLQEFEDTITEVGLSRFTCT